MALYHFTLKSDRKPDGTKIMAHEHAEYNGREGKYEKLDEKQSSVASSDHIDYINRDASFAVKEGCLYKAHHLPEWANGSPKTFFAAADIYEESEHTYKEIEFALQNELTLEQNLEIINGFIAKNFSDYYYAYAVHDKVAALGNGERNLHCHFMFSPRQLDELEKEQERAPECFFKKARRIYTKSNGTIIDNRREGGCKIPPIWNKVGFSAEHLKYLRKDFEETTNQVLQKYGHMVSIDCRSHEARRVEAIKNGNQLEADLFSLPPEKHLGPVAVHNPNDPRVIAIKDLRKLRYETQHMIEAVNRMEKLSADRNLMEKQTQLNVAAQEIDENTSDIPMTALVMNEEEAALLNKNIVSAALETSVAFTKVLSFAAVMHQAKTEMMTPEETDAQDALKTACQEKVWLKNAWHEIEGREKTLRAALIAAAKQKLPEYSFVAEIENAAPERDGKKSARELPVAFGTAANIVSMKNFREELEAHPEYRELVKIKEELSEKMRSTDEDIAVKASCLKDVNLRFATPERKHKIQETALRRIVENQSERDAFQKSSAAELALLKQKMSVTGEQIAALQSDVILYRQAIEEAKEIYLTGLKKRAEIRLPELEKEIAAVKEQITEKENSDDSSMSKETLNSLATEMADKIFAREKLLREKEMLAIFQQHKIVNQKIFELKRHLRQINLQEKKTKNGPARRELQLQKENLVQELKTAGKATSDHPQMQAIRKMFAEKEVKSALTRTANKITLGNAPQRKGIEALQEKQTATVERIRSLMAARIRIMTDTAIGDRLADQHNVNELVKQNKKAERRYTAIEIRKAIYDILAAIRAEKGTLDKTLTPLEARYISEARAKKMAIDLYTQNKTKELRELKREIEKKSERLQKSEDTLLAREYALLNTAKPKWFEKVLGSAASKQYETDKNEIESLKATVATEKGALHSLQNKADKTELEINAVLKSPEAVVKIEKITQGILKKNQPVREQVFSLRGQKDRLIRQEKEFVILASAATRQIKADSGKNISYAPSKGIERSNIGVISIIAKSFSGNDAACAAVARIKDDSLILDWEAKDAADRKAQQRESAWNRGEF